MIDWVPGLYTAIKISPSWDELVSHSQKSKTLQLPNQGHEAAKNEKILLVHNATTKQSYHLIIPLALPLLCHSRAQTTSIEQKLHRLNQCSHCRHTVVKATLLSQTPKGVKQDTTTREFCCVCKHVVVVWNNTNAVRFDTDRILDNLFSYSPGQPAAFPAKETEITSAAIISF